MKDACPGRIECYGLIMNTLTPVPTDTAMPAPQLINAYPSEALSLGSSLTVPAGMGGMIVCDGQPLDLLRPGQYVLDAGNVPLLAQRLQAGHSAPGSISVVLLPTPGTVTMPWSAPLRGHTTKRGNLEYAIGGLVRMKIADPYKFYQSYADAWSTRSRQMTDEEAASAQALSPGRIAELWIGHSVGREASGALALLLLPVEQLVSPGKDEHAAVAQAAATWLASVGLECSGLTLDPAKVLQYGGCDRCGRIDRPSNYGTFSRYLFVFMMRFIKVEQGAFCTPCAASISARFNIAMIVCGWYSFVGLFRAPVYIISNCVTFTHIAWFNDKMRSNTPQ